MGNQPDKTIKTGRAKSLANLIPPKKGEIRNPNGRPKKGSAIADILNEIGLEKVSSKSPGERIEKRVALMRKVYEMALAGDMPAINFVADRTEGKAVDRIIHKEIVDEIIIG
jgi:hypothetical protein